MKIRPLIIDDDLRAGVRALIAYACAHVIPLEEMRRLVSDPTVPPVGDDPQRSHRTPFGYRFVFTVEQHPGGWFRHLSISVPEPGKFPNPFVVDEIMALFGFRQKATDLQRKQTRGSVSTLNFWIEANHAINVVEPLAEAEDPEELPAP